MPLNSEELYGTEADGSKNGDYCRYCMTDGRFTADVTLEEMIELCLPHMSAAHPEITVTCFIPDRRKQGGAYGTLKGNLKKIDLSRRTMVMLDGTEISLDDVVDIQCDLFTGRV